HPVAHRHAADGVHLADRHAHDAGCERGAHHDHRRHRRQVLPLEGHSGLRLRPALAAHPVHRVPHHVPRPQRARGHREPPALRDDVGGALPGLPRIERAATGWGIVAAAFLTFAVSSGMMHSYPVFFVAFLAEFGWGRAQASLAYSASQLLTGASSPVVGTLVDRVGPRRLVLLGGVLLALGLALSAYVSSLWHLVALYGVVMTV